MLGRHCSVGIVSRYYSFLECNFENVMHKKVQLVNVIF